MKPREGLMIRKVQPPEFGAMLDVINDAAQAYKGEIPPDSWKEPYMPEAELRGEIEDGVQFYGYYEDDRLVAVMGIQRVQDVTLVRHAYVLSSRQRRGIGEKLLNRLIALAETPDVLVGTWRDAWWAVRFYEKQGFSLVPTTEEKNRLLREYWNIPERQVETSVVLRLTK